MDTDFCPSHQRVDLTAQVEASKGNGHVSEKAKEAIVAEVFMRHGERFDDPTEVLRWLVGTLMGTAQKLDKVLDQADISDPTIWPLFRQFREFCQSAADVAKKDLDAGVARRRLQLDEARARVALQAIDRALAAAEPDEVKRQKIRTEIGRQLQLQGAA